MTKNMLRAVLVFLLVILYFGCHKQNTVPTNKTPSIDNETIAVCVKGEFEIKLYSEKPRYHTSENVNIWATLKYIGTQQQIEIWSGDPHMVFSITDGKDFHTGNVIILILKSTTLTRGELYHFDYQKSGGYDADSPDTSYWEEFYREHDLFLPEGTYTVSVHGAFYLSADTKTELDLICELNIEIIR